LRNLHITFDWHYIGQKLGFVKFCSLLRIYELYEPVIFVFLLPCYFCCCEVLISTFLIKKHARHHTIINSQAVVRQSSGSHQAVILQSSGSRLAVVWQLSGSRQAVIRQSSGSRQAVVRQSSVSHQAVVR
jgi:hypothetical protein